MTSKVLKTKKSKTIIPRSSDYTKEFRKDWVSLERSGRYDMSRLKAVMMALIANDGPLDPSRRDHLLTGDWSDHRECHIGGDFLLIYQATDREVIFVRTGTHSELFE
jgi:mRNA interferase YafQ